MEIREKTLRRRIVEFLDLNEYLTNEDKADLICVIVLNHLVEGLREEEEIKI